MGKKIIDGKGDLVLTNSVAIEQDLEVGGDLTELSSIAYKQNVRSLTDALSLVESLSGVMYDRKDGKKKDSIGLIAEDVAKIMPNVVTTRPDGTAQGVQYTRIIAYLIEAIKELSQEVKSLKEK